MLDAPAKIADAQLCRIALIGNPNTGKSTLFNVLAGMNARTGNYPGVTVDIKKGRMQLERGEAELIDLPGTYSLAPRSPDELVAVDVLTGARSDLPGVDAVLCVVNATQLNRNLFLVSQLLEIGLPLILVVNMHDVAENRGQAVDAELLSDRLGIPVVLASATKRRGLAQIHEQLDRVLQPEEDRPARVVAQPLPQAFYTSRDRFRQSLASADEPARSDGTELAIDGRPLPASYLIERAILDLGGEAEKRIVARFGAATAGELDKVRREIESSCGQPLADIEPSARYTWVAEQLQGVTPEATGPETTATDRLDALLTGRFSGPIVFVLCMFLIFQAIYTGGDLLMGWFEEVQGVLVRLVEASVQPGIFRSLLVDGVIGGVGAVLIFVPQIALLFLFLALLEDCGYMARAAFMADRAMAGLGLSGRSFLPLMSSFACAVPGVMATRTIDNPRDRLVTMMIAPLMSCSARLPVYLLMIEAFVPDVMLLGLLSQQALVLMAMYLVGAVVAIPVAWLLKKTLLRGEPAPFVLELPEYKVPGGRVVLDRVWTSVRAFVVRAGSLIFWATILIWLAGYLPGDHTQLYRLQAEVESAEADEVALGEAPGETHEVLENRIQRERSRLLENSLLGQAGHALQPLIRPLGWDWRIGVGVLASFPAREVIISTLGTIYSLGGDVDVEEGGGLVAALRASRWPNGEPVFTVPVALSIMVFFALCSQCASTLLVIKKETQTWRWPIFCFTYMTVLAYIAAWLTYNIGSTIAGLS